jgi:hypothetical protein
MCRKARSSVASEIDHLSSRTSLVILEGQSVLEGHGYYSKEQEAPPDVGSSHVWRSIQLKLSIWQHVQK